MAELTRRDVEQVEAFLRGLYRVRRLEPLIGYVLTRLPALVGTTQASWNHVVPALRQAQVVSWPVEARHEVYEAALARHAAHHPLVLRFAATRDPRAFKISDVWSRAEFHATALYDELYRPLGYEDQFAMSLGRSTAQMVSVVVARDRRTFTERDRALLDLVRPHLAQAYRHVRALHRLARLAEAHRTQAATSWIVRGRDGRVEHYPARAQRWMSAFFDDLPRGPGRLPVSVERWLAGTQAARSAGALSPPPAPLVVQRGGRQLVLRLAGHTAPGRTTLVLEEGTAPTAPGPPLPLGLTARELQVLLELEKGQRNVEIAAALGMRPRTVQKHLEHIFDKLGVDSRMAAVAALRRSAPAR
jgi:DNA-binding CsgD family transcriptional regulator